jgi:osmotically-inducible protein OsmY
MSNQLSLPSTLSPAMRRTLLLGGVLGATAALSGCVGLMLTGAAVGALALTDRRTVGAQTEDQSIELKALARLQESVRQSGGITVISFNRRVLLTGFVPDEAARRQAEEAIRRIENITQVHNELQIGSRPSLGTAAGDTTLIAKVKAAHFEAKDILANAYKVTAESGVVYLMGIVTRREGERGAQVASRVSGVTRVVTVFEYVTEEELAKLESRPRQQ